MGKNITIDQVIDVLVPQLKILDLKKEDINIDRSLLEQGVLDSISFLEFVVDLEDRFNSEIEFEGLDPSEFSSIKKITELLNNGNTDSRIN